MINTKWAIGVDLGGTKIEVALIDTNGKIHDRLRIPTDSSLGYKIILEHLARAIQTICNKNKKVDNYIVGIGVAGQIDKHTGTIKYSPNLGWRNVQLQSDLAKKIKHTVSICNDVRAATLGEWHYGSGKGYADFVCIFIGTGIGGGIVSNGR